MRVRHLVTPEGVEWRVRKLLRESARSERAGGPVLLRCDAPHATRTVEAPPDWEELSDAELLRLIARTATGEL